MNTKHGAKATTKTTGKGKAAGKGKRVAKAAPAPEAVVEDVADEAIVDDAPVTEAEAPTVDETPIDADVPVEEAGAATTDPAVKRKRDMSIDDLRAEYLRVIGRETESVNRRYIQWKLSEARKGRVTVGTIQYRPARPEGSQQVLPLTLLRTTTSLLDAAVAASGAKSRSAFIRAAMIEKLRAIGGVDAGAAADALIAEAS